MNNLYDQFLDFKSFEVVFVNEEKGPQKLYCSVKSIEKDSIIIDANIQTNNNVFAEVGVELKLYIYTDNGVYSAASKVLERIDGIISTEYIIAYPENSNHYQRREYFRAEMAIDFRLTIFTPSEQASNIVIDGKTKNISGKGLCYITEFPFPDYEMIGVEIFFKERLVKTIGELVYSKQVCYSCKNQYVHALTFTEIAQYDLDFIVKKCFLHQLDLRKKKQILY